MPFSYRPIKFPANPSAPTPSFAPFPFLPAELRLEIWRLSFTPRVVSARYSLDNDRCLASTPPPAVAHTCRESRYEALHSGYVLAFGTRSHAATIWFAPELDTLYVPRRGQLGYADACRDFAQHVLDTTEHVRRLAIDHVRPEIRKPWETYSKYWLMRGFPFLREAFLVLGAEDDVDGAGQIEFVDPRRSWEEIRAVMDNVKASFRCEVGPDCVCWDGLNMGQGGPCLELIPKAKSVHERRAMAAV